MENLPNIWFYTFSTVAQVMATSVGLFAVFVVYRLQDFSDELDRERRRITDTLPVTAAKVKGYKEITRKYLILSDDPTILRECKALVNYIAQKKLKVAGFEATFYELFEDLVALKADVLRQLKEVVVYGFGTMGLSVVLIATANDFLGSKHLTYILLGFFTLLFLLALTALGRGIYQVTKIHKNL